MAQRSKYWSCTPFADWLRGTPKPTAETGDGWNRWHKAAKVNKYRYWLAEEGLDMVQNALWWPLDKLYDIKYYINNRWVTSTHSLPAAPHLIKRGQWCDLGNRFLPCLFTGLVDFVEVELAWSNVAWSKESRVKYRAPFYSWGWFRWRTWRCPEAGVDYLKWAMTLTNEEWLAEDQKHLAEPTGQAVAAKEIFELYTWWKEVYPNRRDSMDLSGWSALCDARREKLKDEDEDTRWSAMLGGGDETPEEQAETRRILDLCQEIENQQYNEDTEMMARLIKVRNHLWT